MKNPQSPPVTPQPGPNTPTPAGGLSFAKARQLADAGFANTAPTPLLKSVGRIWRDNCITPFNLLFFFLAACLCAVGSYTNVLFLGVVICNAAVGIVQELRVRKALGRISLLAAPTANCLREGALHPLPVEQLVQGDLVVLAAGETIPADAVVTQGSAEVSEALLTGEADPVQKKAGDALLSGSAVVAGQCTVQLTAVGGSSFAARITQEAKRTRGSRSQMMRTLDKLLRAIGLILLPVALALFLRQYLLLGTGLQYAVTSTVGAVVGMIPEGLYLLTSLALAVGVLVLARRRTLVRDLSCIENLARVDILCLDKTGTLTEGAMQLVGTQPLGGLSEEEFRRLLAGYAHATTDENPTAQALRKALPKTQRALTGEAVPFSSARKWGALQQADGSWLVLGAAQFVLGADLDELSPHLAAQAAAGRRVLVLAQASALPTPGQGAGHATALGAVLLADPLRASAASTVAYFKQQGVALKVISGDDAATAAALAAQAGIDGAALTIDLTGLTDLEVTAAATQYTVFGRVTPAQKRMLVAALQQQGHKVAMTGDGVNDLLALRQADCSVAMAAGSEAAQQAAQIVLLDSDFAVMPTIVAEGRRVIHNIERSAALFLTKNILSLGLALVLMVVAMPYPFAPLQLSLISGLTIGVPSFLLTLEPCNRRVSGRFFETVLCAALPGGLTDLICVLAAMALSCVFGLPQAQVSSLSILLVGLVGFCVLAGLCRPFNRLRGLWFGALVVAFLLCFWLGAPLLGFVPLSGPAWLTFALVGAFAPLLLWALTGAMRLAQSALHRHRLRTGGKAYNN